MKNKVETTIQKIIRVRKRIIRENVSGKSKMRCLQIIQSIELQIAAYGNKWDESAWKRFAIRQFENLQFLIPENKAGETIKRELNELY